MSGPTDKSAPSGRRRAFIFILLFALGLWAGSAWLLNPSRVKIRIEKSIAEATGMSAAIAEFDYSLYPEFRASLAGISLTKGDFQIVSDSTEIRGDLSDLLQKQISIEQFTVSDVRITLPEDPAEARDHVSALIDQLTQPTDPIDWEIRIPNISLPAIHAARIGNPDSLFQVTATIHELLSEQTTVTLNGTLPVLGDDALVDGSWVVETQQGALANIEGGVTLSELDVQSLPIENAPDASISLNAKLIPHADTLWAFEVIGHVYSQEDAYFDGPFSFAGDFQNDELTVNPIQWNTSGIILQANAKYTSHGDAMVELDPVIIQHQAVELVANQIKLDDAYFTANSDTVVSLSGTRFTMDSERAWEVVEGAIEADGLSLYRNNDELLGEAISLAAIYRDNQLQISFLTDGNVSIRGTLSPDFENETYAFDLQGDGDLQPKYWQTFTPAETINTLGGTIDLKEASGTYIHGEGIPDDLFIEGTMREGQLSFEQHGQINTITPINVSFASTKQQIRMEVQGESDLSGPIEIEGEYAIAEKSWKGLANGNAREWIEPFIDPDNHTSLLRAALDQLGSPHIDLEMNFAMEDQVRLAVSVESENDASLSGTVAWIKRDSGYALEDVRAETTFNSTPVAESMFEKMYLEGPARVKFERSLSKAAYKTEVILDSVNVYLSEYIEKKPGDALKVTLSGEAGERWAIDSVQIDCLDETLNGKYADGTFFIPKTTIQAANWTPLLPSGSTAQGTVEIQYSGDSKKTSMMFDTLGFHINDELQINRINGELNLAEGIFQTPGLHILGANSDCTVTAILEDDVWNGYLEGNSLDMNAVNAFFDAAKAFSVGEDPESENGLPSESEPASYWEKPYRIEATIQLEELLYGRGRVEQINGSVRADHTGIYLEDFVINPTSGSLSGWASIKPDDSLEDQVRLHAEFKQFDTQILDTMVFNSTRELAGKVSGSVDFRAPRGPMKEMLAQGSGRANWVARDGTFGKMGFATKLLTAMKTVNIINLRLPSLRDKGLTYHEFYGRAEMEDGVVQFIDTELDETSYAMEIEGHVDFAKEETHVNTFVQVLESVSDFVDRIPVVGKVVKKATDKIGVNVALTGSPYELESSVLPPSIPGPIGKPVNSTVKSGTNAVKGIGKTIKKPFTRNEDTDNDRP
jgi:hypothetical protein